MCKFFTPMYLDCRDPLTCAKVEFTINTANKVLMYVCNAMFIANSVSFYVPGVVAFLEEDHYVTPDFLWVLNLLETAMIRNSCKECNLIALGTYLKTWNIRSAHNQVGYLKYML